MTPSERIRAQEALKKSKQPRVGGKFAKAPKEPASSPPRPALELEPEPIPMELCAWVRALSLFVVEPAAHAPPAETHRALGITPAQARSRSEAPLRSAPFLQVRRVLLTVDQHEALAALISLDNGRGSLCHCHGATFDETATKLIAELDKQLKADPF